MKKIFLQLQKQFLTSSIPSRFRKKPTIENYLQESSTKINREKTLPLAFDFIAYYNDIELENNYRGISTDISHEDSTATLVDTADQNAIESNCLKFNPHQRCYDI